MWLFYKNHPSLYWILRRNHYMCTSVTWSWSEASEASKILRATPWFCLLNTSKNEYSTSFPNPRQYRDIFPPIAECTFSWIVGMWDTPADTQKETWKYDATVFRLLVWKQSACLPEFGDPSVSKMIISVLLSGSLFACLSWINIFMPLISPPWRSVAV